MPTLDPEFTRYCADGDQASFRALVSAHLAMVLAVAARKLGPHAHLAQDVAQTVFIRLARVAKGLPRDLLVAPWLHRQAVRLAIDSVRREERRLRRETAAAMLHAPDSAPPRETAQFLDEALDQLAAADRAVLVLRYLEDRDYASVAQALGSTPEAARKRIARSLEKLRAVLARRGVALSTAALTAFFTDQSVPAAPVALTASISTGAIKAAANGRTAAILTTGLMSHATAVTAGALAALLACGWYYQQREKEIRVREAAAMADSGAARIESGTAGNVLAAAPALPDSLADIVAAVERIARGPDHRSARDRIKALLRRVPPEQYLEFYLAAEPRLHPLRWEKVLRQSALEWKTSEPAALTRALFESASRKPLRPGFAADTVAFNLTDFGDAAGISILRDELIEEPFKAWLDLDPVAARGWIASVRDTPLMRLETRLGMTLLEQLLGAASSHPSAPGSLADAVPPELTRRQADARARAWAREILKQRSFDAAMSGAATPAEAYALSREFAEWHREKCREWIDSAAGPAERRYAAALAMLEQNAVSYEETAGTELDPEHVDLPERLGRADLALEVAGHLPRRQALTDVAQAWLKGRRLDIMELKSWLLANGGAEAADALVYCARLLGADTGTMTEALLYADAVTDAATRDPLVRGVFLRWLDKNPAAARAALAHLPAELAAELSPLSESR